MAIKCDCCGEDLTPTQNLGGFKADRNLVELKSGKKCFCGDCYDTLSQFAGSKFHQKMTEDYRKEMQ